jgi:indolepyruvate ferredoxin oxidoreductase alpha subunit
VVVLGDDPGANSSQNEQDNRHIAAMSYIPVLEPATAQEAYEMNREAAWLSRERRMPIVLRLTTHVCHQKQKVSFGQWSPAPLDGTPRFDGKGAGYIPLTATGSAASPRRVCRICPSSMLWRGRSANPTSSSSASCIPSRAAS